MKALVAFVFMLIGLIMAIACSIVVMIFGWGIHPQNWWVIIGVGVFGTIFAHIVLEVGKAIGENF